MNNFLLNRALETRGIEANDIIVDYGIQMREGVNAEVVEEYAEVFEQNKPGWGPFPPVVLFESENGDLLLADGFHRLAGWKTVNATGTIPATVKQGGRREAILFAVGANATNGLHRSTADKRKAVLALLGDPEWSQWSDRHIAEIAAVSHTAVGNIRRSLAKFASENATQRSTPESTTETGETIKERRYTTKHGTTSTMRLPARKARPALPERTVTTERHEETMPEGENYVPTVSGKHAPVALPEGWDWDEAMGKLREAQSVMVAIGNAIGAEIMNINYDPKMVAGSFYIQGIMAEGEVSAYSSSLGIAFRDLARKGGADVGEANPTWE